jgi:hypothetical protein
MTPHVDNMTKYLLISTDLFIYITIIQCREFAYGKNGSPSSHHEGTYGYGSIAPLVVNLGTRFG